MGKKTQAVPPTNALAVWDEELAKAAAESADQEAGVGGGSFITTRGGILTVDGAPVPGNTIAVVIVDSILENNFYEEDFDPDSPSSPACYAFGRDDDEMGPHDESEKKQSETCTSCEHNQWGSADKGRGKACTNRRRLALIPAGELTKDGEFTAFNDEDDFSKATIAFLKVSPTSIKAYAAYVKKLRASALRPPWAMFTRISLVPDPKTQFKIVFDDLDKVPTELLATMKARHAEARGLIEFPYQKIEEAAPPKAEKAEKPKGKKRF